MPYQDTSPAGQHFMNFSRPLSLAVVARAADYLTFELIYGFGVLPMRWKRALTMWRQPLPTRAAIPA